MLSYQFLQSCEANAHLTTLQNRYTVLKMQTRFMQTQQLLGFFSISESTFRGILKGRVGQKKVKLVQKSVLTRRIKRQVQGRVNQNSKFRLSDLLLTARRLVSNATAHRFLKNRDIRNRVAVQDVLPNVQKDRRVNWCCRHLFFDFTKGIFSDG